ncbi:OLC1v1012685C1 [Oldenlandia corymbosa var. corymbosa]|uniref:OLC1v1012685C1 n=1 Tax=Oldenlandia corymbosa var. corymbosa TaxID=529605 RepID=A0AAV1DWP5_OLDCO|nr:OLC1v1012685C1 [Oldenlandia corymbosa var. corymbosa]
MSLLEIIIKASSEPGRTDYESGYPIVLDSVPVFKSLKPENKDPIDQILVRRVNGFEISQPDNERIELGQKFFKELRRKLKNTKGFSKEEFLQMFNAFLINTWEKFKKEKEELSVGKDRSGEGYTVKLVEKIGSLIGRDVRGLVLECCVVLELWDALKALIVNTLVEHSCVSNLINNLIEKSKSDLIVLCIKHLPDIQGYDLLCILKYFLCPSKEAYANMVSIRKEWESQASLAIDKVSDKSLHGMKVTIEKDASLLLMVAYDGFSVSELCLHYLIASKNVDEVILASCISRLNGSEIRSLIQYLNKWLKKYDRFPQVHPCPEASSLLGLKVCEWIPTLEDIVKCFGLVVDEHFSSILLHPEFHEDMKSIEEVASSLADEARWCGSMANLVESLKRDHRGVPATGNSC